MDTERRILPVAPHQKAHSACKRSRRLRLSVTVGPRVCPECAFPSRCGAREVWGNHPPGCGALWRMPQLGKCARATPRQPAGRVARGSADLGSESGLTERRTLQPVPHGKAHSATGASRKSAFSNRRLTEKRILRLRRDGKARSAFDAPPKLRFRERVQCLPRLGMNQNRSRPRPSRPPPESAASA